MWFELGRKQSLSERIGRLPTVTVAGKPPGRREGPPTLSPQPPFGIATGRPGTRTTLSAFGVSLRLRPTVTLETMPELGGELLDVDKVAEYWAWDGRVWSGGLNGGFASHRRAGETRARRVDLERVAAPTISPRSVSGVFGLPEAATAPLRTIWSWPALNPAPCFRDASQAAPALSLHEQRRGARPRPPRGRLRLSAPRGMNDPLESEPIWVSMIFAVPPMRPVASHALQCSRRRAISSATVAASHVLTRSAPYDYGPAASATASPGRR